MKPLFVHVGLPRAGSTFFQNRIFAEKQGLRYVGKSRADYPRWLMEWHYLSEYEFSQNEARIRSALQDQLSDTLPNLLSSEMFTMWGGRTSDQAKRLFRLVPDARIIMILREPLSRMLSFYKAIVEHDGFFQPLKEMIDWKVLPFVDYKRRPIQIHDFQYDSMVAAYQSLFGRSNVCVLRLEDMESETGGFWEKLSEFTDLAFGERERGRTPERLNASLGLESVSQKRRENLRRTMSSVIFQEQTAFVPDLQDSWIEDDLLPRRLRKEITHALRGKCSHYLAPTDPLSNPAREEIHSLDDECVLVGH